MVCRIIQGENFIVWRVKFQSLMDIVMCIRSCDALLFVFMSNCKGSIDGDKNFYAYDDWTICTTFVLGPAG